MIKLVKPAYVFFDKLEDKIRALLSRYPILYAMIGGVFVVLFWRGVWHTADLLQAKGGVLGWIFYEPVNTVIAIIGLLATGLFVSIFIGDAILISGLSKEKKLYEKTEAEVKREVTQIDQVELLETEIKKDIQEIKASFIHIKEELDDIKSSKSDDSSALARKDIQE
jgi:hypothetical protein